MFNKSSFCHIASNNRNEQKGSVFIYKTTDTLAQVTQSGYFNEKLIDINLHDLIIHVQYDPVARTLKKSFLIVTERTMDNVETTPILDQTIYDDIDQLGDQVQGIEEKIPGAASAANQLADKAFVNAIKTAIETTITELSNAKADRNLLNTTDNVDFVVESQSPTAENTYTWYRKYKSGWVEQGGKVDIGADNTTKTITLPIEMESTNAVTLATGQSATYSGEYDRGAVGAQLTATTTLQIKQGRGYTTGTSWYVAGYAA